MNYLLCGGETLAQWLPASGDPVFFCEEGADLLARLQNDDIDVIFFSPEALEKVPAGFKARLDTLEKGRLKKISTFLIPGPRPAQAGEFRPEFILPVFDPVQGRDFLLGILRRLELQNRLFAENFLFKQDLELARRVHNKILENPLPPREILDVSVQYIPHLAIGGDIYCIKNLGRGRFLIFLSDATGHGLKAALIIMVIKSLLEEILKRDQSPAGILAHINENISGLLGTSFCGTAFCALLDLERRKLRFANAAHPPQVLWKRDKTELDELYADSVCLGIFPDETFEEVELDWEPGDRLVLFTDGLYEFQTGAGRILGLSEFYKIIQENRDVDDMATLASRLISKVKSLHRDPYQGDDINLIAARFPV